MKNIQTNLQAVLPAQSHAEAASALSLAAQPLKRPSDYGVMPRETARPRTNRTVPPPAAEAPAEVFPQEIPAVGTDRLSARRRRRSRTPAQIRVPDIPVPANEAGVFTGDVPPHMDAQQTARRDGGLGLRAERAGRVLRTAPGRRAGRRGPLVTQGLASAFLRLAVPALLLIAGIVFVALNWATVSALIFSFAFAWIASFFFLLLITRHHLDVSQVAAGATVLAVIALLLRSNAGGLGDQFRALLHGTLSLALVVGALILIFRRSR